MLKSSELPILENRVEKLLLVCFYGLFLFRQMVEKLWVLSGPYCIISAYTQDYEFKLSIQTNFDTNLKSQIKFSI